MTDIDEKTEGKSSMLLRVPNKQSAVYKSQGKESYKKLLIGFGSGVGSHNIYNQ